MENFVKKEKLIDTSERALCEFKVLGYKETYRQTNFQEDFYAYLTCIMHIANSLVDESLRFEEAHFLLSDLESTLEDRIVNNTILPSDMKDHVSSVINEIKSILNPDLEVG